MEPAEIIRACLSRGVLVSGEDLKRIEAGLSIDDFLASKQPQAKQPREEEKTGRLAYRLRRTRLKDVITPADLLEQHKNKYETIKGLLLSKASVVSISNVRDSASSVSLIGMVRQSSAGGFVLEDVTGEIDVVCDAGKNIEAGDVIGVRGPVKNSKLLCKEIIFPDVPLIRAIGRIDATLLIVPKEGGPATAADIVLSTSPVETHSKNIVLDSSPSHLSIYKDGRFNILFFRTESEVSQQAAINMLKKRLLGKPAGLTADTDALLIDPVPDIFWVVGKGQDWIEIYKGVTIIHTPGNSDKQVLINLRTRESKLI